MLKSVLDDNASSLADTADSGCVDREMATVAITR